MFFMTLCYACDRNAVSLLMLIPRANESCLTTAGCNNFGSILCIRFLSRSSWWNRLWNQERDLFSGDLCASRLDMRHRRIDVAVSVGINWTRKRRRSKVRSSSRHASISSNSHAESSVRRDWPIEAARASGETSVKAVAVTRPSPWWRTAFCKVVRWRFCQQWNHLDQHLHIGIYWDACIWL